MYFERRSFTYLVSTNRLSVRVRVCVWDTCGVSTTCDGRVEYPCVQPATTARCLTGRFA